MDHALATIHQSLSPGESLTLSYAAQDGTVALFVECDERVANRITNPLLASYPRCALTAAPRPEISHVAHTITMVGKLTPELFPLLRHPQFEDALNRSYADPIENILRAVRPDPACTVRVEWQLTPATPQRVQLARDTVQLLDRDFFRVRPRRSAAIIRMAASRSGRRLIRRLLRRSRRQPVSPRSAIDTSASRQHDREELLQAAAMKVGGHLFDVQVRLIAETTPVAKGIADDRLRQLAGALGAFTTSRLSLFRWQASHPRRGPSFLLSTEELATLFHPPTGAVAAESLLTSDFTELPAPAMLPSLVEPGTVTLGRVRFRDDARPVQITRDARRRHVYIVGATGTGKSTLLLNLMAQGLTAGEGLTVIDVHGDLADGLLALVPSHRTNDVIVFDPVGDNLVPFNPLACTDPQRRDQVVSGVVSAFRKLYDSWGPRLENLLRFAVFAVVEQQGTLLDVVQLLTEASTRDRVVPQIEDPIVRAFWQHEFPSWNGQYRTEAVSSVTNKVLPFLTNRQLRAIVTEAPTRGIDLRQVMDRGQVLIVKLSRGRLGQDHTTLLGSLLLTAIEQAALSRADLPEAERRDHSLYLDEFQTLVTPSTGILLSESRKYRLNLTLSHQLTRQLDDATWQTVLGNCGTFVTFRVGLEDAELLSPALSKTPGQLAPASLMGLPNYTCYVRLPLTGGLPSPPFSVKALPPPVVAVDRSAIVRAASQRRFGRVA